MPLFRLHIARLHLVGVGGWNPCGRALYETNTERRIQRLYRVFEPLGQSRPDWQIIQDVANRLGAGWQYANPSEIYQEISSITPLFAGVSYERLEGYKGPSGCCIISQEFYETDRSRGFARGYSFEMLRGFGPVSTAIRSRQTAGIRGRSLIVNLPGQPKAIRECLDAVMPAIPYCVDLIGGPYLETNEARIVAFRPKK